MGTLGANPVRVAVVDDDDAVRAAISSLVRSAGCRCATFESAEDFLESGGLGETDCILLDIRMPGMDGRDLHLVLRRMNCHIPVIYVTATADGASRNRAFRQGATAVLPKPFDDEELLGAIHTALNGK
jgi:FixJ family two-component response regulator